MDLFSAKLTGDRCIVLRFRNEQKICIHSPERIITYSIVQGSRGEDTCWMCYCLTLNRKLYLVHRGLLEGHRVVGNLPPKDEDIFSGLLCDNDDDAGIELQRASQLLLILEPSDIILTLTDQPVGLCITDSYVIVTTQLEQIYTVSIHEAPSESSDSKLLINPVRVVTFPAGIQQESFKSVPENRIIMKAVVPELSERVTNLSTDCVSIALPLFKHLFGQDMSLSGTQVLLLAPPTGSVYFLPLNSHIINTHHSLVKGRNLNGETCWRLFCQTSTPVVDIVTLQLSVCKPSIGQARCESCIKITDKEKRVDALVLGCSDGLVKVIHQNSSCGIRNISSVTIRDPVVTMCSYHNRLFHSTRKQLYETVLHMETTTGPTVRMSVAVARSNIFNLLGVTTLSCKTQNGCIDHPASPYLLTLALSSGEVMEMKSEDLEERSVSRMCSQNNWSNRMTCDRNVQQSGNVIRNTLRSIEHTAGALKGTVGTLGIQVYWITQISIMAHLLRFDLQSHKTDFQCRPASTKIMPCCKDTSKMSFRCVYRPRVCHSDGRTSIFLDSEIINQLPHSLTTDWSLQVTLLPPSTMPDIQHITKTQKLIGDMKQGDSIVLSLAVSSRLVLSGFEMLVSVVLSVPNQFIKEQIRNSTQSGSECLTVDIHHEYVDILHFVVPDTTRWQHRCAGIQEAGGKYRCIQALARDRPAAEALLPDNKHDLEPSQAEVKCGVVLNHDVFTHLEACHGKGTRGIFGYLLENSECSEVGNSTNCRLITMFGHLVCMSVIITPGESIEMDRKIIKVEVTVVADLNVAAGIHMAVLKKLQVLETSHRPSVHVRDIRKQLELAQDLEKLVASLQQASSSHQPQEIVQLFQQLRSIHL